MRSGMHLFEKYQKLHMSHALACPGLSFIIQTTVNNNRSFLVLPKKIICLLQFLQIERFVFRLHNILTKVCTYHCLFNSWYFNISFIICHFYVSDVSGQYCWFWPLVHMMTYTWPLLTLKLDFILNPSVTKTVIQYVFFDLMWVVKIPS